MEEKNKKAVRIMNVMELRLQKAFDFVQKQIRLPEGTVGIIPGTGWGRIADALEEKQTVDYASIPDFPRATFHKGAFTAGKLGGHPVILAGRLHYYEGCAPDETVMPLRILKMLGVKTLFLTNASGGIAPGLVPGSFMAVTDHIQFFLTSPLRGENLESFGPRFPDLTGLYSPRLRSALFRAAEKAGVPLYAGVYAQMPGPQFETPAEVRALKTLGADAVGMSTATEAVAARHAGMEVAAVSFVTNYAAGVGEAAPGPDDILAVAEKAVPAMTALLKEAVREFANLRSLPI